jgi:hypothetical protein
MTGFYTTGAHPHPLDPTVLNRPHSLKVWVKTAFGYIMGMTYVMTGHRFFAAYITHPGHDLFLH